MTWRPLLLALLIGVLVALSVFMLASALYRWDLLWISGREFV